LPRAALEEEEEAEEEEAEEEEEEALEAAMEVVSMGVVARENLCMVMEPMRLVKLSMADVRLVVLVFRCSRLVLLRNKEVLVAMEEEGLCSGL
jgi:CO dehydrogenase/acetyl-CoA synthase beta subunit